MNNFYKFLTVLMLSIFLAPEFLSAQAIKDSIRENYTQEDYEAFLLREMRGEIPDASGPVMSLKASTADVLVNNNSGSTGTGLFTQSETSVLAFGNTVVIGFNDSGSRDGNANKFTGWAYSTDGGETFTDGGTLPTDPIGDAGDPVLARDETTGRIYFATLGYTTGTIQVFVSDDDGVSWDPPVVGTRSGSSEDKQWMVVDNFSGAGNGNVYLISRRFGGDQGIYLFTSTDNGATFGPDGGVKIVNSTGNGDNKQGAFVVVGPDHSVYAFWMDDVNDNLNVRRSTDFGATFGSNTTFVSGLAGSQTNNGLNLTGERQGAASFSAFRSNSFPHVAVNPITGDLYVVYNDNPAGDDKANIYMVMSDDAGATWTSPMQVNDDPGSNDNWQPTIAVTPDGLNLAVFYSSREDDEDNNLFTYNGRKATISGSALTWTPSFTISDIESLPEFGRDNQVKATYMGDYNTAFATNTHYHVVWSDNRDDLADGGNRKDPNVYYKGIPVSSTPPVAICQPVTVPADVNCQAYVSADEVDGGSGHPEGLEISLNLSPEGPYPLGTTSVTLTASAGFGLTATCNTTITVVDVTPPMAPEPPADLNVQCTEDVPDPVDLTATDNCDGDITVSPQPEVTPGDSPHDFTLVRTWTFTDASGNTSSVSQTIVVFDDTPPVLTVIDEPVVLWPPNHKYQTIDLDELFVSVTDNCSELSIDDVSIKSVSSDEPDNAKGDGDGNTWQDIMIESDCRSVDLRKERAGGGNGRVYTVTLTVTDENFNETEASCKVHVPHDEEIMAIEDFPPAYTEDCNKSKRIASSEKGFMLENYPNPFHESTTIRFKVNESDHALLKVYDMQGNLVETLFDSYAESGREYAVDFTVKNEASGIYLYHFQSGKHNELGKMTVVK